MSNDNVVSLATPAEVSDPLTELLRSSARRLIEAAVSAEFEEYLSAFGHAKLPDGRQRVVRTGTFPSARFSPASVRWRCEYPSHAAAQGRRRQFRSSLVRRTFEAVRASMRRFHGCTCIGYPPARCVRQSTGGRGAAAGAIVNCGVRRVVHAAALLSSMITMPSLA